MNCKACHHRDRDEIDRQLIAGASIRSIAASFGLSLGGLVRHKGCIKEVLTDAMQREQGQRAEQGGQLLERVLKLMDATEKILATATSKEDLRAATGAVGALTRLLELLGRLSGELQSTNTPGIHLTLNQRITNTSINNYDNDVDFAMLVSEATRGFDPMEIDRLKALIGSSSVQPEHNELPILLNP